MLQGEQIDHSAPVETARLKVTSAQKLVKKVQVYVLEFALQFVQMLTGDFFWTDDIKRFVQWFHATLKTQSLAAHLEYAPRPQVAAPNQYVRISSF